MPNTAFFARQDAALAAYESGLTFTQVARLVGYADGGAARRGVCPAVARRGTEIVRTTCPSIVEVRDAAIAAQVSELDYSEIIARRFGVEIEFYGITIDRALEAINETDIVCESSRYGHVTSSVWKITTDSSVTSRGTGMGCGLECVSPILSGAEGYRQIRVVMDALRGAGAKVNRTCGLHVHMDVEGLTGDEIARVFEFYCDRQPALDMLVPVSRRYGHGSMYHHVDADTRRNVVNGFRSYNRAPRIGPGDRYYTINAAAYLRHGTLEIRQHQGTLNPTKALAWVAMVHAIFAAVVTSVECEIRADINFMSDLAARGLLPSRDARHLRARARGVETTLRCEGCSAELRLDRVTDEHVWTGVSAVRCNARGDFYSYGRIHDAVSIVATAAERAATELEVLAERIASDRLAEAIEVERIERAIADRLVADAVSRAESRQELERAENQRRVDEINERWEPWDRQIRGMGGTDPSWYGVQSDSLAENVF